jgi:putative peptidoglycan lipid II flippase
MSLIRSTFTVGIFTATSRILGMLREVLLSHILGASTISDAFVVAFKMPNFFRRFFGEGAFNAAFVPLFASKLTSHGPDDAKKMAEQIFAVMAWALLIFVVVVLIFTKPFLLLTVPGLLKTPERLNLAVTFTRFTFPYIFFISLVALLSGILNSLDKFAAAAAVPILLNVVMISALLCIPTYGLDPGIALCIGVFVAGALQFGWMYLMCRHYGFTIRLRLPHLTRDVRQVLRKMLPGAFGAGVMQINLFIDMALASFLPVGAMTYLYYADRLNQLPLSVFGVAISTVLLPTLSRQWRQHKNEEAHQTQRKALEFSLQLTFPAAVGLAVYALPFIDMMYGHGKFKPVDVLATAPALAAFVLGLPAYVAGKVFSTTFFSLHDTKTPVKVAIGTIALNLVLNIVLMRIFLHVGLALATSLTAWVNTLILGVILTRRGHFRFDWGLASNLIRMAIAALLMGAFLYGVQAFFAYPTDSLVLEVVYCMSGIAAGMVVYFVIAHMMGVSSFPLIKRMAHKLYAQGQKGA